MNEHRDKPYVKWGLTALVVIFVSILLVVIFTDLPGFFGVLTALEMILEPLIFGVVIAFLLNPIVRFVDSRLLPLLEQKTKWKPAFIRNLSRAAGIFVSVVVAVLILYAFFSMLLPQLYESVVGIVDNAETYYTSIDRWVTNILEDNPEIQSYVDSALGKIYDFINNWITTTFLQDVQKLLTTLTSSVVAFVKGFMNFLIGFVASIYILWSKETFQAQSKKIIVALLSPKGADHVFYLGRNIYRVFNGFVIGKIVDSAIIGVLCYIGILILKMPYPALIATVIGVTNVIPVLRADHRSCAVRVPHSAGEPAAGVLFRHLHSGPAAGGRQCHRAEDPRQHRRHLGLLGACVHHHRGQPLRLRRHDPGRAGVCDHLPAHFRFRQQ